MRVKRDRTRERAKERGEKEREGEGKSERARGKTIQPGPAQERRAAARIAKMTRSEPATSSRRAADVVTRVETMHMGVPIRGRTAKCKFNARKKSQKKRRKTTTLAERTSIFHPVLGSNLVVESARVVECHSIGHSTATHGKNVLVSSPFGGWINIERKKKKRKKKEKKKKERRN